MSIASRITAIEGHIADDYNALEYIGADLTNVDKNIENIKNVLADIYDEMPKVSDTGTDLTLENTRKGAMSIKYKGDTQQDSTTGKNLLPLPISDTKNGIQLTTNSDGSFTLNGTATTNSTYRTYNLSESKTLSAGTYTLYYNVSKLKSDNSLNLLIRTSANTNLFSKDLTSVGSGTTLITLSESTTIASFRTWFNVNDSIDNSNIQLMLVSGSTAGDFEPYTNGASPNPDYPQDIHNVSGDNTIEIEGRNRFDNTIVRKETGDYSQIAETIISTGKRLTYTSSSSASSKFLVYSIMDLSNYVGKTIRFKANFVCSASNTSRYYIGLCNSDGSNRTSKYAVDTSGGLAYFTVPTLSGSQTYLCVALYVNSGGTVNQNDYVDFTNMILTIDDEDMTYEAYTGNSQLISLGVENLLNLTDGTYTATDITGVVNNGVITLNGTASATRFLDVSLGTNLSYVNAQNYTVSLNNQSTNGSVNLRIDGSGTFDTSANAKNKTKTFTYDGTTMFTNKITIRVGSGTTLTDFVIKPQMEKGSKANSYSEYGKPYIELNKISTYQDYIYKDNDRWYLHKEIGKWLFDNNSGWSYNSANTIFLNNASVVSGKYLVQSAYCNYYKNVINENITGNSQANSILNNNEFSFRVGTQDRMYIKDTRFTSIEDFNTWLSTNNLIVYYVLATPTDTEITDTTLLEQLETIKRSYDSVTNISQENNDLPFILDVSALKEWE